MFRDIDLYINETSAVLCALSESTQNCNCGININISFFPQIVFHFLFLYRYFILLLIIYKNCPEQEAQILLSDLQ